MARAAALSLAALMLAGCEGPAALSTAGLQSSIKLSAATGVFSGSTQEIYTRIARGARSCWLGPGRPLERTHMFQADLQPEAKGGSGEISIHRRAGDAGGANVVAAKAGRSFIVSITRAGDASSVAIESRQLPEAVAETMKADVLRWAKTGTLECGVMAETASLAKDAPPLPTRKPARKAVPKRQTKR